MSTKSHAAILDILNQAPRITVEATKDTSDINEAYLIVHAAMARAFAGVALLKRACDDAPLAASVADALDQPLRRGDIGHSVAL